MDYSETNAEAAEFGAEAFSRMARYRLAAHPRNYAVWYAYASGHPIEVKQTLDVLISNGRDIGEQTMVELYGRYIDTKEPNYRIAQASSHIEQMLTQVLEFLIAAQGGAQQYDHALKNFSGKLALADAPTDIRSMFSEILSETRAMAALNQQLESQLSTTHREVEDLKGNLESLKREATTDAVTGLANRKHFDTTLRETATSAMEKGEILTVALLDIDHFKIFNDTHGHLIGDQVLKLVARTILDGVKGQDTAARYGGEEFAIILPRTGLRNAHQVMDQIRLNVAGKKIVNRRTGETLGQINLSGGVAEYVLGEPLGDLVHRADEALYRAKRSGRNRIVTERDVQAAQLELKA